MISDNVIQAVKSGIVKEVHAAPAKRFDTVTPFDSGLSAIVTYLQSHAPRIKFKYHMAAETYYFVLQDDATEEEKEHLLKAFGKSEAVKGYYQ